MRVLPSSNSYVSLTREDNNCSVETVKEPLLSSSPTSYESSFALHPYNTYQSSSARYTYTSSASSSSLSLADERSPLQREQSPLTGTNDSPAATRPRSKSKPTHIFIHPTESNLARADAAALQMGLAGDTERVKGNMHSIEGEAAWKMGEGKGIARQIMCQNHTL